MSHYYITYMGKKKKNSSSEGGKMVGEKNKERKQQNSLASVAVDLAHSLVGSRGCHPVELSPAADNTKNTDLEPTTIRVASLTRYDEYESSKGYKSIYAKTPSAWCE